MLQRSSFPKGLLSTRTPLGRTEGEWRWRWEPGCDQMQMLVSNRETLFQIQCACVQVPRDRVPKVTFDHVCRVPRAQWLLYPSCLVSCNHLRPSATITRSRFSTVICPARALRMRLPAPRAGSNQARASSTRSLVSNPAGRPVPATSSATVNRSPSASGTPANTMGLFGKKAAADPVGGAAPRGSTVARATTVRPRRLPTRRPAPCTLNTPAPAPMTPHPSASPRRTHRRTR